MTQFSKTFAKIETPEETLELSKREFDEIRMLVTKANTAGIRPNANPPVHETTYEELEDFLATAVRSDGYIDKTYRGPPADELEDVREELVELREEASDEKIRDQIDDRLDELDAKIEVAKRHADDLDAEATA
jgi:hypothetical protein